MVKCLYVIFAYVKLFLNGSLYNEQNYDPSVINDIEICNDFLNRRLLTISLANEFFPNGKIGCFAM